jgi:Fe-S cluster assembly iron-binding protein IscA
VAIEVHADAAEVLRRSLELVKIDPARGGVRLRGTRGLGGGFDIQVEMAEEAADGEEVIESGGLRLFVDPRVTMAIPDAIVALDPQHDTITVRPRDASN